MRLLAPLVSTSALLAPRAPAPRKTITRTTRRHAPSTRTTARHDAAGARPSPHSRSLSQTANAVELVQPATADDRAPTLNWAGGTPFSATAKQIVDGYYGPEFATVP